MRPSDEIIVKSFLSSLLITSLLTWIGLSSGSRTVAWILVWHIGVMVKLVGPGPLLGYDEHGNPMYEGTPVHMLAALVGMVLGFLVYWLLSLVLLQRWPQLWPKIAKR